MTNLQDSKPRFIIVGSGFFGLTIAERISEVFKEEVLVIERRDHIGGNAFSYIDHSSGIEVHKYGTHIFHTSNQEVWEYINRFSSFNDYRHKVVVRHDSNSYFLPINLSTINNFFGKFLTPTEARELIMTESKLEAKTKLDSLEDKAVSLVGRRLYKAFIETYTKKQWEVDASELPASTIARLPVRFNYNIDYFEDKFQGLPVDGYHSIFKKMIENPLITLRLDTDFFQVKQELDLDNTLLIYTGALDKYFEYTYGELGWRTLDFEIESHNVDDVQGTSVINYVDGDVPFTRIHEFRHLHPEREYKETKSLTMKEISRFASRDDEPYYPINSISDREKLISYRTLMDKQHNVIFGGRLGTYKYLDMHMAIASALNIFKNEIVPWWENKVANA